MKMTDDRSITGIASKEVEDSDNTIIDISSMRLKEIRKTKKFLFSHMKDEQIGTIQKVWKSGDELWFKAKFYPEGKSEFVDALYYFFKKGILQAFSIGIDFFKYPAEDGKRHYKVLLREISLAVVGKNSKALPVGIKTNDFSFEEGRKSLDEVLSTVKKRVANSSYEENKNLLIQLHKKLKNESEAIQDYEIERSREALKYALTTLKK